MKSVESILSKSELEEFEKVLKEIELGSVKKDFSNMPSISLLLGAGFSVPKGYPTGKELNEQILACDGTKFTFYTDGSLVYPTDGNLIDTKAMYRNRYERSFDFVRQLIRFYNEKIKPKPFDYEKFYDYLVEGAYKDKREEEVGKDFCGRMHKDVKELLNDSPSIYAQMIDHYLKDGEGKRHYYDEGHACKPTIPGYTGVLNCFEQWGKEGVVHIHTLNHDLYLERLAVSDWMNSELSDGFNEIGSPYFISSPYFGGLTKNKKDKIRVQFYNGKYDKKFRLYKLHGSRDYACYRTSKKHLSEEELELWKDDWVLNNVFNGNDEFKIPVAYLKMRTPFSLGYVLYREICDDKGNPVKYEIYPVDNHADFLTGTTSKIKRYGEPLIYKELFEYFKSNLEEAEKLIIIGYGAKDEEINRMLVEHFDHQNKSSFIVDPCAGDSVKELQKNLGATLITTPLEDLTIEEFS